MATGLFGLDLNDPQVQLGFGLLALGGAPRSQFAAGLNGLLGNIQKQQEQEMVNRYRQAQIAEIERKGKQDQRKQDAILGLLGGGGPAVAVSGADQPAQTAGGASLSPMGGGLGGRTIDQIAALKALGGIDLTEQWKLAQTGVQQDAGKYYTQNGRTTYAPQLAAGQAIDPTTGRIFTVPGYAESNAGIEGARAGAISAAQYPYTIGANRDQQNTAASLDPMKVYDSQAGREMFVPRQQVARGQAQQNYVGGGYNGGSANAAAQEQLAILGRELLNARTPEDRAAVLREISRLPGGQQMAAQAAQSGGYAAGPTAAESAANKAAETTAVDTAKANVGRESAVIADQKNARKFLNILDQVDTAFRQGPTQSGIGSIADQAAAFAGYSTKGAEAAQKLKALGGWLVSNVPRMEGPQSNFDVANYQVMAGDVANENLPLARRQAAAEEVRKMFNAVVANDSSGAREQPQAPQAQRQTFDMLPNASQYDGKRMRGPDGTVYRSTGGRWVKE